MEIDFFYFKMRKIAVFVQKSDKNVDVNDVNDAQSDYQ